jgi:hypothetical protein
MSPNDPKRRVECCGIPLKPKAGLNGHPAFVAGGTSWSSFSQLAPPVDSSG